MTDQQIVEAAVAKARASLGSKTLPAIGETLRFTAFDLVDVDLVRRRNATRRGLRLFQRKGSRSFGLASSHG